MGKITLLSAAVALALAGPAARAQTLVQGACGAASSCVVKASPGSLLDAYVTTLDAGYLFVFNAVTAPTDGSVTAGLAAGDYQECLYVPDAGTYGLSVVGTPPVYFNTGITLEFSSTGCDTLTAATPLFLTGRSQ